jgi:hypothetical protein
MNSLHTSEKNAIAPLGSRWLLAPGYRPSGLWVTRTAR